MNRKKYFTFLFVSVFLVTLCTAAPLREKLNRVMRVAFVVPSSMLKNVEERNDLLGLKFSLSVAGIRCDEIPVNRITVDNLQKYDIIVLPYAAAKILKVNEIDHIKDAVKSGSDIVFDGVSDVVKKFNIKLKQKFIRVSQVRDIQFPKIPLYWQNPERVRPVLVTPKQKYRILCADEKTNNPLVVSGKYGKGIFIFFSPLFDPYTDKGYSRFPFLIETLSSVFGYVQLAERKTAGMYFDPGNRNFMSADKLVKLWREYGVQRVYAGGWYFLDDYTYDYGQLIEKCHENGILVYCWFEFPMVNIRFWNKYPQWREKTALLKDAKLDWRYLENLADPQCRQEVFKETGELLNKYDWDGVDLAELYFESTQGPAFPEHLTPMNGTVRKDFSKLYGYDPVKIFNSKSRYYWKTDKKSWLLFAAYRRDLCNKLKTDFLDFLTGIRNRKKDFEIMITAIDASNAPDLEENISEDTKYLLSLIKKYSLTLQAEDEWMFWSGKPERYDVLGKYYRRFIKDPARLEIDFNVVDNHIEESGGLPTIKPTGEEMRQVVYNIDLSNSRPAFYAEDTIYKHDFKNINMVLARDAIITQKTNSEWQINTPHMITVHTGRKHTVYRLDDEVWLAGDEGDIIIPAGNHILSFGLESRSGVADIKPHISYISGELTRAHFLDGAVEFSYTEDNSSCYAIINKKPKKIYIDDKLADCRVYVSNSEFSTRHGGFSIKLPGGRHAVKVITS